MPLPTYDHITTLLEDVFEPIIDPYCPIYVIDFKVCAHFIHNYAEAATEFAEHNEEELRKIIRAMWAYRLNRGPDMLKPHNFVALIADDLKGKLPKGFSKASSSGKGYWRHIEAHKLSLKEYKGGRGEKTKFFDLVQEEGYKYIKSPGSTFSYFAKEFFEADDVAGHICRLKREAKKDSILAQRQIILGTLDGDWQGLVSDSHDIVWANTGPWLPRLRSEREVCDYYLRKEALQITSAQECYAVKTEVGDAGDNLQPGTPLRFFDLYDEDTKWRFTEEDSEFLLEILNSNSPSNRQDHLESAKRFLQVRGFFLPEIPPIWETDRKIHFERAARIRLENSCSELKGRHRTLCLSKTADLEVFEKCKEIAIKDIQTHEQIKKETETLRECRKVEDKKCVKELRALIRGLKEMRISFKEQLLKLA